MAVDTSIYNQLLQRPKSVAELDAERTAQQTNQLALRMGQQKADEYSRGLADTEALRGVVGKFGDDRTGNYNALLRAGRLDEAQKYKKSNADIAETQGKADEQRVKLIDAKLKQSRSYLDSVRTPEQYIAWHEANHADEVLGPALAARGVTAAQARASIIQAIETPGGFEDLLKKSALGIEKFTELNKPTIQTQNLGGTSRMSAVPGLGGAPRVLSETPITQDANSVASNATTIRGQNMTANTARESNRLKSEENGINREGIVGKRTQDVELKLQDDYRAESKGFSETSTAMKKVLGAISTADKNPGSALAAGTAFMKILDPNSVVRESELGMALNASGWFDRATNVLASLQAGKIMTATQKTNLQAAAENLFEEAKAAQLEVDAAYSKRATDYGADPKRVIVDRGQNTKRSVQSGGGANPAATNAKGWSLHTDANGNKAYVSPDGKQFQEVK